VRGAVRIIPVQNDLAFVQPTYAWRAQGTPALLRVSALVNDTVRVGSTLLQLAGTPTGPPSPPSTTAPSSELRARAVELYGAMRDALHRGDWAAFGRAFDDLGKLLSTRAAPR
jgi:uncharacterized membrane protein (UPF0182 family)